MPPTVSVPGEKKTVLVMVGLPARGKSFMSRKIERYLLWSGLPARVFNVGAYRRERFGSSLPHEFFDPNNDVGNAARLEMALEALDDMLGWLRAGGEVAIYDATNTVRARRDIVRERCLAEGHQVLFVESICHDEAIIESNIRQTKARSPDYAGVDQREAVLDFTRRIEHYASAYEEVADDEGSYVKTIDVGRTLVAHDVEGYVPSRLVFFLLNMHIEPRPIFLTRHGESEFNVEGRIGGDTPLTSKGAEYAKKLGAFVRTRVRDDWPPVVWTSTLRRTAETAEPIGVPYRPWRALDEIDAGVCDGMTYPEIADRMPAEYAARSADKLNYRYPRGESYQDVIGRLEPVIFELERERAPVLIVGHQAVLRAVYAYLKGEPPAGCTRIPIPLHTLLELTPTAYGVDERRFAWGGGDAFREL